MKRRAFIGGALSAIAAFGTTIRRTPLSLASPAAKTKRTKTGTMILLHTNDLHGHLTGLGKLGGTQMKHLALIFAALMIAVVAIASQH